MRNAILAGETRVDVVSIVSKNISLFKCSSWHFCRWNHQNAPPACVCACVRTSSSSVLLSHLHVVLVLVEGAFWQSSVTDGDIGAHV